MASSCPKCRLKCSSSEECEFCGLNFKEYEQNKLAAIGRVYDLIKSGDFEGAGSEAEKLPKEFPDKGSDFLLLLAKINRDISIVEKYRQAREAFDRGDCEQVAMLLRNIKAFDQNLDEKVISLRKKAQRFGEHDSLFARAVDHYKAGKWADALELLVKIEGYKRQDEVDDYLAKIDEQKNRLFNSAVRSLRQNHFDSARDRFAVLHEQFPDMAQQTRDYLAIISQQMEIRDTLLAAAGAAREADRPVEAKVLYIFLCRQNPELRYQLTPYIEEIGSQALISLADSADFSAADFAALGLQIDESGMFVPEADKDGTGDSRIFSQETGETAPFINPQPFADPVNQPVDIVGEEVADFTY